MVVKAIMPLAKEGLKKVGAATAACYMADKVLNFAGLRDKDDENREIQESQIQDSQMDGADFGQGFNPNEVRNSQYGFAQTGFGQPDSVWGQSQFAQSQPGSGWGQPQSDSRGFGNSGFGQPSGSGFGQNGLPYAQQPDPDGLDSSDASMSEPVATADKEPEEHGGFMQTAMAGLAAGTTAAVAKWKETFKDNPDASVMDGVVAAGKGFALGAGSGALTKMSLDAVQDDGGRLKAGLTGAAAGVLNSKLMEGGPGVLASAGVGLGSAVSADMAHDKLADAGHERMADAAGMSALAAGSAYTVTGSGGYAAGAGGIGAALGGATGGEGLGDLASTILDKLSGDSNDKNVDHVSPSAADDMELGE